MSDTYPWPSLPEEGKINTSIQILGMGKGLERKNEIAELVGDGFNVYRVKVLTLEAHCGFSLVSLWLKKTDEEKNSGASEKKRRLHEPSHP